MKKRERPKLTEEQRKAAVRRVLQRSAKDILYIGKIVPNKDNPRAVAKYLAKELFDSPPVGARKLRALIEWRWNVCRAERAGYDFRREATMPLWMPKSEQRFIGQMLIALGEYLLNGKQVFDDLDYDIADIIAQHTGGSPRPTIAELICELKKRRPNLSVDDKFVGKIKQRVRRLLKHIPQGYLEPLL